MRSMIPLPMSPATFLNEVCTPALGLLPPQLDTQRARVMLLAICLQESGLSSRWQILNGGGKGPARGLPQFELGGGTAGVIRHEASRQLAKVVCDARRVSFMATSVWLMLERDDVLAVAFARLLLLTDPRPLPALGKVDEAWDYYLRNWRPGKPHPEDWPGHYAAALAAVTGA